MSNNSFFLCPKCKGKLIVKTEFCNFCAFDLSLSDYEIEKQKEKQTLFPVGNPNDYNFQETIIPSTDNLATKSPMFAVFGILSVLALIIGVIAIGVFTKQTNFTSKYANPANVNSPVNTKSTKLSYVSNSISRDDSTVSKTPNTVPDTNNESVNGSNGEEQFMVRTKDKSGLNLRLYKDLDSESVTYVEEGDLVTLLYYDDQYQVVNGRKGKWCRVKANGKEGWVWGWHITNEY
jgi:hypothetical protein